MIEKPFPVIDLKDIVLRQIVQNDANDYLKYMSKDEMRGFLNETSRVLNYEQALSEVVYWGSLFQRGLSVYWAIALKDNNKMIGTAGFNAISYPNARGDISYDLDYAYWGKGIMLKSIKAIMHYAFTQIGLVRIQATVIVDNARSIKVLERCGLHREGYMKKYEVVEGAHKDYYMYAKVV